jgi:hypothetical protein
LELRERRVSMVSTSRFFQQPKMVDEESAQLKNDGSTVADIATLAFLAKSVVMITVVSRRTGAAMLLINCST